MKKIAIYDTKQKVNWFDTAIRGYQKTLNGWQRFREVLEGNLHGTLFKYGATDADVMHLKPEDAKELEECNLIVIEIAR